VRQLCAFHPENSHTPFQIEPLFASVTRIEKQDFVDCFGKRFVCVAEHNDVRLFSFDSTLEIIVNCVRVDDVMHEELSPAQFNDFRQFQVQSRIGIAHDRSDGRDGLKFMQEHVRSNITGVENVINAGEQLFDARVKKVVRVRDDADAHDQTLQVEGSKLQVFIVRGWGSLQPST